MTREQAKEFLVTLGIAEPTEDNITSYLNSVGAETKRANERANAYKADADKAKEYQQRIEEMENEKLSDIEKANKATEQANSQIAELQSQIKSMQLKADLATNGIVGEKADELIKSLESGSFDANLLGQLIAEREKTAVANFEKEKMLNTPNPTGGEGAGSEPKEPADVVNAKQLSFGVQSDKKAQDFYKLQ